MNTGLIDASFQGAIFDQDGTLVDSMGVWRRIDEIFLKRRGIIMDEIYHQTVKTAPYAVAAQYTLERYGLTETAEEIMREWDAMALEEYQKRVPCKKGAAAYLKKLKEQGVKIALATLSPWLLSEAVLRANGIYEYFDVFTDVSQVSRSKEEPDLYLLAAEKLRLAPGECVVFEDVLPGILSAKRAGFRVCAVRDHTSREEEVRIRQAADWYIEDFQIYK
ncbi:MAG: HAD family phosphatase [Lachnospiraceae bacterium]|nr:HAD family phosphatase [Lachnospiraceae bacterium]